MESEHASRPSSVRPKSASSIPTHSPLANSENGRQTGSRQTAGSRPVSATSCYSKRSTTKSVKSEERSSRPISAKSTSNSVKTGGSGTSANNQKVSTGSRPTSASSVHTQTDGQASQKSSSSRMAEIEQLRQSQTTTPGPASTIHSEMINSKTTNSRAETHSSGRRSKRTSGLISKQAWTSKAEIRANEVRKDLYK